MDRKIRVGAVSYLNTKPLIYGFEKGMMKNEIDLTIDYPAKIADALIKNEIDIGLIPVAVIPEMDSYYIIGDYCIGSEGEVASVCLFSEVPLQRIETVLLDYQSRTSVKLVQVLMKEFWKIKPVLKKADADFRSAITGTTAAVVIGDRALEQRNISKYYYDLSLAWKQHTGLPFVFAAWISNKQLDDEFVSSFNNANEVGLKNLDEIVAANEYKEFDLKKYYTDYISYNLTANKRDGLNTFLKKMNSI